MTPEHNRKLGYFYEIYSKELIRFAYGRTNNWQSAEDLVQRTFEIACRKEEILDTDRNIKTWLLDILILEIKNHWRANNTRKKHFEELDPNKEYEHPDSHAQFDNVDYIKPAGISEEDFNIVKLMAVYGLSCAEAADCLQITEAACYKRYQRAKKKIKKLIE